MKKSAVLTLIALMIGTSAHAQVSCIINRSSKGGATMEFDQQLFNGVVSEPTMLLIDNDKAEPFVAKEETYKTWLKRHGKSIVTLGVKSDGVFGISVSHIDVRRPKNILPTDALSFGNADGYLSLIVPKNNLSITCTRQ